MTKPDLRTAVNEGNLEVIRSLLDAGADVRYVAPHGYTVMIDVMHGRSIADDEQLLPVLRLLIERGADLDAVSDYGESALSVASYVGRFDAVGLLLDAGADPKPLKWTPLLRAVALGSAADVESQLKGGADLAARDRWDRTAWLLSLHAGDMTKAKLMLAAGADPSVRGRCGRTPLTYAIGHSDTGMLRWLLTLAADPNETDEFGQTPLIEAAREGRAECVRVLLRVGANVHHRCHSSAAIHETCSLEVARILIEAGADLNDVNDAVRAAITRLPGGNPTVCTREEYRAAKHRVFGTSNPQQMNFPFWKAMVASGKCAHAARMEFKEVKANEAVWCFDRVGTSINELPDGRVIEIAGEHEDSYDCDFCIYNDVIVHRGDGTFDVYGYPADVFPPTDFHTATLVGNSIYVIGNAGYQDARRHGGTTPVYFLDVETLAIERVETSGESPGWISRHKARLVQNGIMVSGGTVCRLSDGKELYDDNTNTYLLDLATRIWSQMP